jgi:hypothetical protein
VKNCRELKKSIMQQKFLQIEGIPRGVGKVGYNIVPLRVILPLASPSSCECEEGK